MRQTASSPPGQSVFTAKQGKRILVCGNVNIETTVRTDKFPIEYLPVRFPNNGVDTNVAAVGYNIARALTTLGDRVRFLSLIGRGLHGQHIKAKLAQVGVPGQYVLRRLEKTAQSVVLYEPSGERMIFVDTKDIQKKPYPKEKFNEAIKGVDLAVLCTMNYARPYLKVTKKLGIPIATDVHVLSQIDNDYDKDFMRAADILFMSDENLPVTPEIWAKKVGDTYGNKIIVIGLGDEGALLHIRGDNFMERIPAITSRPIVSTVGAGDALLSCFVHYYLKTNDPVLAISKATLFASYKIGEMGGAEGFLSEKDLENLETEILQNL